MNSPHAVLMSETKWTPGPWRWVIDEGVAYLRSESAIARSKCPDFDGIDPIADDGSAGGEYEQTINPDMPNAQLIAAAPDLYDALFELWHDNAIPIRFLARAAAALAEARGESAPIQSPEDPR